MPLPNFLVLGAPRSATTWLHSILGTHPDIFIAPMKEPEFFSNERRYANGLDWYRALFAEHKNAKRIGEVSVNYFFDPKAPKRIHRALGATSNLKLIVLLREPIDRAISHYTLRMQKGEAPLRFEKALDDPKLPLRKEGHYIEHYKRYLETFAKEQIGIFLFEDIQKDSRAVLMEICRFLDVDPEFFANYENKRINESSAVRSVLISRALGKLGRLIRFVLPYGNVGETIRGWIQNCNRRWNRKKGQTPIRPDTRNALEREYAKDNAELAKQAGIDLSAWQYGNGDIH